MSKGPLLQELLQTRNILAENFIERMQNVFEMFKGNYEAFSKTVGNGARLVN